MKLTWIFRRSGEVLKKKALRGEGMDIFWNYTFLVGAYRQKIARLDWSVNQSYPAKINVRFQGNAELLSSTLLAWSTLSIG